MTGLPGLAVFASGNGSNLQALLDGTRSGEIPARVALVVSDRADAFALERARKAGVEALHVSPKDFPGREAYDAELVRAVKGRGCGWVALAGFMRILSPVFVRAFPGRILNIHPALLPKYPGTHAIERALAAGEKELGVTVHWVDEGVDTGPILLQSKLDVKKGETLTEVTERVHALEHRLYPEALRRVLAGKEGRP